MGNPTVSTRQLATMEKHIAGAQAAQPTPPPDRRRWMSLSLRSLMVAIVLLAVWLAWQVNRARAVRRAISLLQAQGHEVRFDERDPAHSPPRRWKWPPIWLRNQMGDEYFFDVVDVTVDERRENDDRLMATLRDLPRLRSLRILDGPKSDASMEKVAALSDLKTLLIVRSPLTDSGLARLKSLPNLQTLAVESSATIGGRIGEIAALPNLRTLTIWSSLDDDAVNALASFKSLRDLSFNHLPRDCRNTCHLDFDAWSKLRTLELKHVPLRDEDAVYLDRLTNMEELRFNQVTIDDRHLIYLRDLKGLKYLQFFNSWVTGEGIAELKKHLPTTTIYP